ncbi:uncharacterized protein LOC110703308 [Chenopodium quinoa]|uniref:uncharacterized protein LOC110703308 n=1 Tax=Chenopodium quinoa TaxID=63459 RepID=UPI000B771C9B|nr:uncharacterized protein LOC110703308 [Chenopodium quinoa]
MNTSKFLHTQVLKSPLTPLIQFSQPRSLPRVHLPRIRSTSNGQSNNEQPTSVPPLTPPETVEIKFRRGSRKRRRQQESGETPMMKAVADNKKKWEEMSLSEKAIELYMGEKGFLFWVNKFAYASIFIIIGGWILFRFVGPSLNLYQLDTPPLSPQDVLKG